MKAEQIAYMKGYRVDEEGNVLGIKNKYLILRNKDNYYHFQPRKEDGSGTMSVMVHRLAAYQWFGDELYKPGIEVRHLDGNSLNNNKNNIAIGTKSQNAMDKKQEVRIQVAKNAAKILRRLTEAEVAQLRLDRDNGATYSELMDIYDIAKSTISYIVNYKTYK